MVERTTGSVYHALGRPDADEMERKAKHIPAINDTISEMGYTQVQAAEIVGVDQPTLSKLLRGRFRGVSIEKLADMLNALGCDVTIVVGVAHGKDGARGRIRVAIS